MNTYRNILDKETETHLVFPDTIVFRNYEMEQHNGKTFLSMDVSLQASSEALASFQKARQVILSDMYFSLSKPDDPLIKSFRFAKTEDLQGRIVIKVLNNDLDHVETQIKNNPLYLKPEYTGTTEEYVTDIDIAMITISTSALEMLNTSNSLPRQVFEIINIIKKQNDIKESTILDLCTYFINQHAEILNTNLDGIISEWVIGVLTDRDLSSSLTERQPAIDRIYSNNDYFEVGTE